MAQGKTQGRGKDVDKFKRHHSASDDEFRKAGALGWATTAASGHATNTNCTHAHILRMVSLFPALARSTLYNRVQTRSFFRWLKARWVCLFATSNEELHRKTFKQLILRCSLWYLWNNFEIRVVSAFSDS